MDPNQNEDGRLTNGKMERQQFAVICILGMVATLCVAGIVLLRVNRLEVDPSLTAGLCTSLGALTGILVNPAHKYPR